MNFAQSLSSSALKEQELQTHTKSRPYQSFQATSVFLFPQPNYKMSLSSSQPQQPGLVYPNTVSRPPPSSPSHSDGSFGTSFIVLAVIVVISAIACCLGRLCSRRFHKEKPSKQSHTFRHKERPERDLEFAPPKGKQNFRPRERENRDLEFGFDKNIAASKPAGNGESRSFKQFGNGDIRFDPKFAGYGKPKATA